MYESQTFITILHRMLDVIPDTIDKREGSIIWDTLAPAAMELYNAYRALDYTIAQQNPKTADRTHLEAWGDTFGITPIAATQALLEAKLVTDPPTRIVPVGTKFRKDDMVFYVESYESGTTYYLRCEQAGEIGNEAFGRIQPVYNVTGLQSAEITGLAIPGTNVESDTHYLQRFLDNFQEKAFGGNMADYRQRVTALQGVGGVKIFRHFQEKDFQVEVVIIDSRYQKPTEETVEFVQEQLHPILPQYDQPTIENSGDGLAPIGHIVYVFGVEEKKVDINLHVDFASGNSWEQLQDAITEAIEKYFESLREDWANKDYLVVRISGIESQILGIPGVLDVYNTQLAGEENNLTLEAREIPILGEVTNG